MVAAAGPAKSGPAAAAAMGRGFFRALSTSHLFKETKVSDIAGSYRWAPFLPVRPTDSLLTLLLLLSKYRMKSVPVVEAGEGHVTNFITQSGVVQFLAECAGLDWFDAVASRSLADLGLPLQPSGHVVTVEVGQPVLEAFRTIVERGFGAVAVVETGTKRLVGNISAQDVRFLVTSPETFAKRGSMTVAAFMETAKTLQTASESPAPLMSQPLTCSPSDTLAAVISKLADAHVHRLFVTSAEHELLGVVTLRDIISRFVEEPEGYFGGFFAGVLPATPPAVKSSVLGHSTLNINQ
eukprot:SM000259S08744  [mRNA]  locus=s259:28957:30424:- [translate_table: standard]